MEDIIICDGCFEIVNEVEKCDCIYLLCKDCINTYDNYHIHQKGCFLYKKPCDNCKDSKSETCEYCYKSLCKKCCYNEFIHFWRCSTCGYKYCNFSNSDCDYSCLERDKKRNTNFCDECGKNYPKIERIRIFLKKD